MQNTETVSVGKLENKLLFREFADKVRDLTLSNLFVFTEFEKLRRNTIILENNASMQYITMGNNVNHATHVISILLFKGGKKEPSNGHEICFVLRTMFMLTPVAC